MIDVRSARPVEAALALASLGMRVFPIYGVQTDRTCACRKVECMSPGKHPRTRNGHLAASANSNQISEWWGKWPAANVGLRAGGESGLIFIDVDPRNGGHVALAELERIHGPFPVTIKQKTGSGGWHFAFKHPGFRIPDSASRLGPGLDVRGVGYVVVAPSSHVSGSAYEWADGHAPGEIDAAQAPQWLLDLIVEPRGGDAKSDARRASGTSIERACRNESCRTALRDAAERYVAKARALSDGRKNNAFALASHVAAFVDQHGCRLSEDDVIGVVAGWNRRCDPPLDDSELRYRVRNALRYGDRADKNVRSIEFVEPLPALTPTRPVVHSIDEALVQLGAIVNDWQPGTQSLYVQTWAGCGKTTIFARHAATQIASGAWGSGAILALRERDLVREKLTELRAFVRDAQLEVHDDNGSRPVPVREQLGRSSDSKDRWFCARHERVQQLAELRKPVCAGCSEYGDGVRGRVKGERGRCATTKGMYWHSRNGSLPGKSMLVASTDSLRSIWGEVPKTTPIILDDAGPLLGLVYTIELRLIDIESAIASAEDWRSRTSTPDVFEAEAVAEVFGCDIALCVLRALHARGRDRSGAVELAVRGLPPELRQALIDNRILPAVCEGYAEPWPWEADSHRIGVDCAPEFASLAIDIAREVLVHGHAPFVERVIQSQLERGAPELRLHMPDRELIERARAGYVVWLGVAPPPPSVLAALGVRHEIVHADPAMLQIIVGELRLPKGRGERIVSFGPGDRAQGVSSHEDELVRAIARAGAAEYDSFGAVLHLADREALGDPKWCRSYGSGHSGTNDLAGRKLTLVRRFVPPYMSLALDAAVLRRTLRLEGATTPPSARELQTACELRAWFDGGEGIRTNVPRDLLERELLRAAEAHGMLNAIGRSRALSAKEPVTVLLLAGRPFDLGGAGVAVRSLSDALDDLNLRDAVELPNHDARRAALDAANAARKERESKRLSDLQALLRKAPHASQRRLARELKCSPRTLQRLLARVRGDDVGQRGTDLQRLRAAVIGTAQMRHTLDKSSSIQRVAEVSAPGFSGSASMQRVAELSAAEVAAEVRRDGGGELGVSTARRFLGQVRRALRDGSELLVPKRTDAATGLTRVVRAVAHLVCGGVVADPASAGEQLEFRDPDSAGGAR